MTEHWWARCEHPANCGWESRCYPSRPAAVGAAGQHMRKHEREGMAPGVRASTRVRQHDVQPGAVEHCAAAVSA